MFDERKTKKQRTRTETDLEEGQRKKQRRADQYRRIKGRNIRDTKEESAEEVTEEILQHRVADHQRPIKNRHRKDTITYYYVLLMYKEALNKGDK